MKATIPAGLDGQAQSVLSFWFDPSCRSLWFERNDDFDRRVRERLLPPHEAAAAGSLDDWMDAHWSALALAILLDQVPRNVFRGTPRAFSTDPLARAVARRAIDQGFDLAPDFDDNCRLFFYLPFEHSEDLADQDLAVRLFCERTEVPRFHEYAIKHRDVIVRFGRFPHRNAVLGRLSTEEELAFLETPGSRF